MSGIQKGDILRATRGVIDNQPVTYLVVKNKEVMDKLANLPDVLTTGQDPNGELWLAIPKELALKDFVNKVAASFKKKIELQNQLKQLGLKIINGNYVKKSDAIKIIAKYS